MRFSLAVVLAVTASAPVVAQEGLRASATSSSSSQSVDSNSGGDTTTTEDFVLTTAAGGSDESTAALLLARFENWADEHGKEYESEEERSRRWQVWMQNDVRIRAHNEQQPPPTFTLGHNAFSDLTLNEFVNFHQMKPYDRAAKTTTKTTQLDSVDDSDAVAEQRRWLLQEETVGLPDYVNWVEAGAVTEVKNQGSCGACWAFSTTGALEGAKFVKTGELVALSEQNLLDCDHVDLGCSGGLMDNAFKFDMKTGGLCSEEDYPYKARQSKTCSTNCTDVPGSIVDTFIDVPAGKPKALLRALAMQPVAVAIQGSQFVFQFYKTGVITDTSCGKSGAIDHGVLAVGYGTDLDTQEPYFLVKNSWGPTWGDAGYVKIGRSNTNQYGICSILRLASFPVVK